MIATSLPTCRQCRAPAPKRLGRIPASTSFAGQQLEPAWDGGILYECRKCKLGFRHPIRSDDEYERLYDQAPNSVWVTEQLRPDQRLVLAAIRARHSSGKVLDVGCYDGALLEALGPEFERFGVEASRAACAAAQAKGVTVLVPHIRDMATLTDRFDVITAVDVIEHVSEPLTFLRMLTGLLKPGGDIIISTGTLDAPAWRRARGSYWYCAIPEHISFVSRPWLETAAAQLSMGLKCTKTFYYIDDPTPKRAVAQARFASLVQRSNIKQVLARWVPGRIGRMPPRTIAGEPGTFEDHILAVLGRPGLPQCAGSARLPGAPNFSIVMPCLNAERHVAQALDSLLSQTYRDFEVVVADGASSDQTLAVVESFRANLPHLKIISGQDSGVYDAINKGISASRGQWVYILGSDDRLYADTTLGEVAAQVRNGEEAWIYGDVMLDAPIAGAPHGGRYMGPTDFRRMLELNICQQAVFYRRAIFDEMGLFKTDFPIYADWEFGLRAMAFKPSRWMDLVVCRYSATGLSATRVDKHFLSRRAALVASWVFLHPFNGPLVAAGWWLRLAAREASSAGKMGAAVVLYTASFWLGVRRRFEGLL